MELILVSYRTASGQLMQRQPLQHFAVHGVTGDIVPARSPVAYKNQRHLPGHFYMSRMHTHAAYESRLEMTILLQLDFNQAVRFVIAQPCVLHYRGDSRAYHHIPDFLVGYQNGAAELINVKPRRFVETERNRRAFSACERAAVEMGWAYSTRCEMNPILLANLKWLAAYRRPPTGLHEYGPHLMDAAQEPISIADVISFAPVLPSLIRPVLFHLIWMRVLDLDLHETMNEKTLVRLTSARRPS